MPKKVVSPTTGETDLSQAPRRSSRIKEMPKREPIVKKSTKPRAKKADKEKTGEGDEKEEKLKSLHGKKRKELEEPEIADGEEPVSKQAKSDSEVPVEPELLLPPTAVENPHSKVVDSKVSSKPPSKTVDKPSSKVDKPSSRVTTKPASTIAKPSSSTKPLSRSTSKKPASKVEAQELVFENNLHVQETIAEEAEAEAVLDAFSEVA